MREQNDNNVRKNGKNVLFLCLSPVNIKGKQGKYRYQISDSLMDEAEETKLISGFMTNEAPAKAVIEKIAKENSRNDNVQKLDKIVVICSEKTKNPIIPHDLEEKLGKYFSKGYEELPTDIKNQISEDFWRIYNRDCFKIKEDLSSYRWYENSVNRYACESYENLYSKDSIDFIPLSISDDPDKDEITKKIIKAADMVQKPNSEEFVNLYIDYNGGQRHVAFMIQSISEIMKVRRNVAIKEILSMNYNQDDITLVEDMLPLFKLTELVSGINEYVNYGRTRMLKQYFKNPSKEIDSILDDMDKFSKNLNICRIDQVLKVKESLREKIRLYMENNHNYDNISNLQDILFTYVVNDIYTGYKNVFEGDDLDLIEWCNENDFLQQALTFYVELIPEYLSKNKIYYQTDQEKQEYDEFCQDCENNKSKYLNNKETEDYVRYTYGNDIYNWFCIFLKNSYKYKNYYNEKKDTLMGKNCFINRNKDYAEGYVNAIRLERAASVVRDEEKLKQIIRYYYKIKDQRNAISHAEYESNKERWSYSTIRRNLKDYIKELKNMVHGDMLGEN